MRKIKDKEKPHSPKQEIITVPQKVLEDRREESNGLIAALARAASDPKTDVDKMERLWMMHKEAVALQAEREFGVAKNQLQPNLPVIKKNGLIEFIDKKNNLQKTPYALREDIEKAIRPLYTAAGFSTEYNTEYVDGKIITVLILRHVGGHVKEYRTPPMPLDTTGSKNNNQAAGSTVEYGRRYAIVGAFNVITEGLDDDGNHGGNPAEKKADNFAARAAEETKKNAAPEADVITMEEAAERLSDKIAKAPSKERRGAILMANVKLIGELEAAGLAATVISIRKMAEEEPTNA